MFVVRSGASVAKQVSDTLDYLLFQQGYNKQMRPNSRGKPVEVTLNLAIRNIGPVGNLKYGFFKRCDAYYTTFQTNFASYSVWIATLDKHGLTPDFNLTQGQ